MQKLEMTFCQLKGNMVLIFSTWRPAIDNDYPTFICDKHCATIMIKLVKYQ